jgi:acyl carrier protein
VVDSRLITFPEFQQFVSDALAVEISTLAPEAYFFEDLAVNSMTLVELVLRFETELGVRIPTEEAWNLQTVGDAYRFYLKHGAQVAAAAEPSNGVIQDSMTQPAGAA